MISLNVAGCLSAHLAGEVRGLREGGHRVKKRFRFGGSRGNLKKGGRGKPAPFFASGRDDRFCGTHQAHGDAGGFTGGRVTQVDAAIDGGSGEIEMGR